MGAAYPSTAGSYTVTIYNMPGHANTETLTVDAHQPPSGKFELISTKQGSKNAMAIYSDVVVSDTGTVRLLPVDDGTYQVRAGDYAVKDLAIPNVLDTVTASFNYDNLLRKASSHPNASNAKALETSALKTKGLVGIVTKVTGSAAAGSVSISTTARNSDGTSATGKTVAVGKQLVGVTNFIGITRTTDSYTVKSGSKAVQSWSENAKGITIKRTVSFAQVSQTATLTVSVVLSLKKQQLLSGVTITGTGTVTIGKSTKFVNPSKIKPIQPNVSLDHDGNIVFFGDYGNDHLVYMLTNKGAEVPAGALQAETLAYTSKGVWYYTKNVVGVFGGSYDRWCGASGSSILSDDNQRLVTVPATQNAKHAPFLPALYELYPGPDHMSR
jgi:hypothetical protein